MLIATAPATALTSPQDVQGATRRIAERIAALQREAADLATREKTLLTELRQLELQRQIRTTELAGIEAELRSAEQQLADAEARAEALEHAADLTAPDVEARLVRLYKMGRGGYWRLLLDSESLEAARRAYRTAAAMTSLERQRIREHAGKLEALRAERDAIAAKTRDARALRDRAAAARAAIDRTVAERSSLVASIDDRRDLAVQMARELEQARGRLERALAEPSSGGAVPAFVPIKPFKGALAWPAAGIVVRRFGPTTGGAGIRLSRNGIDISIAEGRAVAAVHDGTITMAAPLTGYGNVVIVDHGSAAQSVYGHLSAVDVRKGERVTAGARLGATGRNPTGNPTLYFELRIDGRPVDPLQWLRLQP